jgi:outer membrane murein-binding lipoprotein Lpp
MLEVRISHRMYRITNATLDQLFGAGVWRTLPTQRLIESVKAHHDAGRLVIDGQRLRSASVSEEAAHRLRTSKELDEIIRSGLLSIAAQIAELASDVRSLREQFELDGEAANAPLARAEQEMVNAAQS